jgi:hypothetical protein
MVLGELLQDVWNSNGKEDNVSSVDFPQGAQFLLFKEKKTQSMDARVKMLTDPNGFCPAETLAGQQALVRAAGESMVENRQLVEGFEGIVGPTAVNEKNARELAAATARNANFKTRLSQYTGAQEDLMKRTQSFVDAGDKGNPYAGQNVRLANGQVGYVTDRGFYKWYDGAEGAPGRQKWENSTWGQRGCPAGVTDVTATSDKFNVQGTVIESDPPIWVGSGMKPGQPCGQEGTNIQVTQMLQPDRVNTKYEGCYEDVRVLAAQPDLGVHVTEAQCRTRAADLGKHVYAYRNTSAAATCPDGMVAYGDGSACKDNGTRSQKMQTCAIRGNAGLPRCAAPGIQQAWCGVGDNLDQAKSGGIATRPVTSSTLVGKPGAISGGLLNNGQVGVTTVQASSAAPFGSASLTTSLEAVPGCDPAYGGYINTSNSVASYGVNCNSGYY